MSFQLCIVKAWVFIEMLFLIKKKCKEIVLDYLKFQIFHLETFGLKV